MLKRVIIAIICMALPSLALGQNDLGEDPRDKAMIGQKVGNSYSKQPGISERLAEAKAEEEANKQAMNMPLKTPIDYISDKVIPLDAKEQRALALSKGYQSNQSVKPYLDGVGKLIYVFGAIRPSIVGSPMNVCDVELQQGEVISDVMIGDSARWQVETAMSGSNIPHLLIKPVDAGLETSVVVTTDKRVYHLRLVSQRTGHMAYVGFAYPEDTLKIQQAQFAKQAKQEEWNKVDGVDGAVFDLSKLNFNYIVKGRASWKPSQVYDDGRQIFIKMPSSVSTGEMPALLVSKGDKDILVNYRVKEQSMIVDGLFPKIILIVGIDSDQEKIEIIREK